MMSSTDRKRKTLCVEGDEEEDWWGGGGGEWQVEKQQ